MKRRQIIIYLFNTWNEVVVVILGRTFVCQASHAQTDDDANLLLLFIEGGEHLITIVELLRDTTIVE